MGIFCQINLFKPGSEVYHPGQDVSGVIKYSVNEPTEVDKIVTSLKGIGFIVLKDDYGSTWESTYETTEVYVDQDTIVQGEKTKLAVGSYELKFNYILPNNIPSSMKFRKCFRDYKAKCFIVYYVRIKFERPGLFTFNKHFRKEIIVLCKVIATLPREPTVYTENKQIFRLFSTKGNFVNISATIINSLVPIGGTIEVQYEVQNNSHVEVKSIKMKLIQSYTFKAKGHRKVTYDKDVEDTEVQTLPINSQETQRRSISITAPTHLYNLGNSIIVARNYLVRIVAHLPIPYKNAVLDIPVEIGVDENIPVDTRSNANSVQGMNQNVSDDPPPSYWEVMHEANKELDEGSDNETDTKNLLKSGSPSHGEGSSS